MNFGRTHENDNNALERRLGKYLAASATIAAVMSSEAEAVVVSNTTVQPFGINGDVNIDFNSDGQIDYQIDHDRVNLNGTNLDYLQVDKNDASSAENPYPISYFTTFPVNGTPANSDHWYVTDAGPGENGYYPSALLAGAEIGPDSNGWDFQEGDNYLDQDLIIRANRLLDEDLTQIDAANPNPPQGSMGPFPPFGTPGWVGHQGQTRYLGLRLDLNDAGHAGLNEKSAGSQYWYGWIGVRIDNEADATGVVTGWGYESQLGESILAGATAPGVPGDYNNNGKVDAADYVLWRNGGPLANESETPGSVTAEDYTAWRASFGNPDPGAGLGTGTAAIPEPGSLLMSLVMGVGLVAAYFSRRVRLR